MRQLWVMGFSVFYWPYPAELQELSLAPGAARCRRGLTPAKFILPAQRKRSRADDSAIALLRAILKRLLCLQSARTAKIAASVPREPRRTNLETLASN